VALAEILRTLCATCGRLRGLLASAALVGLAVSGAAPAQNPGIHLPAGGEIRMAAGELRSACIDLHVDGVFRAESGSLATIDSLLIGSGGQFLAGSARLRIGGDLINAGQFQTAGSRFDFVDGCTATSRILGVAGFHQLAFSTDSGKRFELESGRTLDISGGLTVQGTPSLPAQVVSSNTAAAFIRLGPGASASVTNADLPGGNVYILGGSPLSQPQVIPSNSLPALLVLALLISAITALRLRRP
jgi:hypothetical protein